MRTISNQNWLDVAVQETGSIEAAFALAAAKGQSITDLPPTATEVTANAVNNRTDLKYIMDNNVTPGTNGAGDLMEGLGYWELENDFEVQ